jgi:hypothetical protein
MQDQNSVETAKSVNSLFFHTSFHGPNDIFHFWVYSIADWAHWPSMS